MGTALLVVAVGLLGLRVLGQSNDRVGTLGALQKRAVAYGKLQSDASHVRLLLAENVGSRLLQGQPDWEPAPTGRGATAVAVDQAVANALARIGPATIVDSLGFVPSAEDEGFLRKIRAKSGRLSAVMREIIDRLVSARQERDRPGPRRSVTRPSSSRSTSTSSPRSSRTPRRRGPTT